MAFKSTKHIIREVSSHTMRAVLREVTHTHTAKTDKESLVGTHAESILVLSRIKMFMMTNLEQ